MMTISAWHLMKRTYPQIEVGIADAKAKRWTDLAEHNGSMAYEIGRMLAVDPERESGAFVTFSPFVTRAIQELTGASFVSVI